MEGNFGVDTLGAVASFAIVNFPSSAVPGDCSNWKRMPLTEKPKQQSHFQLNFYEKLEISARVTMGKFSHAGLEPQCGSFKSEAEV